MTQYRASRWPLLFATLVIGVFSGFGGMFLAILLHFCSTWPMKILYSQFLAMKAFCLLLVWQLHR